MSLSFRTPSFRTLVLSGVTLLFLGASVSYVLFQARFLIAGPQIVLTEDPGHLHNERVISLTGNTHNITHLWLNDRPIYTDETGTFREALVLENGYTVTTLRATDRYGRETRVERTFVYVPSTFTQHNDSTTW